MKSRFGLKFLVPALVLCLFLKVAYSNAVEPLAFECRNEIADSEKQNLLANIDTRYASISSVIADFVQNSYLKGFEQSQSSRGKVYFKSPGLMDWQYAEPEKQKFITDGKTLWYYQPGENQVTIGDFINSFKSELPVSFLLGLGRLQEKFRLKSACSTERGQMLGLQPLEADASLQEFFLLVDSKDFTPYGARVVDIGGNDTAISLVNISVNKKIDEGRFKFEIPMGVDIIDNRSTLKPAVVRPIVENDLGGGAPGAGK